MSLIAEIESLLEQKDSLEALLEEFDSIRNGNPRFDPALTRENIVTFINEVNNYVNSEEDNKGTIEACMDNLNYILSPQIQDQFDSCFSSIHSSLGAFEEFLELYENQEEEINDLGRKLENELGYDDFNPSVHFEKATEKVEEQLEELERNAVDTIDNTLSNQLRVLIGLIHNLLELEY